VTDVSSRNCNESRSINHASAIDFRPKADLRQTPLDIELTGGPKGRNRQLSALRDVLLEVRSMPTGDKTVFRARMECQLLRGLPGRSYERDAKAFGARKYDYFSMLCD
jgi:hypothetical protein